jgi:hypothetical protein
MFRTLICASALALSSFTAHAAPALSSSSFDTSEGLVQLVAGGCGPNAWRGPYGGCRNTPFYGRLPNGYYQPRPIGNGCPPGYWRGPWGHCRNTPYHGRLPNGGWK